MQKRFAESTAFSQIVDLVFFKMKIQNPIDDAVQSAGDRITATKRIAPIKDVEISDLVRFVPIEISLSHRQFIEIRH